MHSKEELKKMRKEAYQKAKAKRDADPAYQALKEKQKREQKAKYQAYKTKQKDEKLAAKRQKQEKKDAALLLLVTSVSQPKTNLILLKFDKDES